MTSTRQPGPPPTERSRWARWRRGVWSLAAGVVMLAAITLYGWRYGFSALPDPVPGADLDLNRLVAEGELPASNFWYHIRAARPDLQVRHSTAPAPALRVADPEEARQAVLAHFERAASAPDRRPPLNLGREEVFAVNGLTVEARLAAGHLAGEGDHRGALRLMVALWRFQAALVPSTEFAAFFSERGVTMLENGLCRPFEALVTEGPALPPAEGLALLRELEAVLEWLPPAEHSVARQMSRDAGYYRSLSAPDWTRAGRSLRMALLLMRQDLGRLVTDVLEQILSRRQGGQPNYHGAAHLLRPVEHGLAALQTWVARPEDFDRLWEASLSRTCEALRQGTLDVSGPAPAWLPGNAGARSLWRRMLDRPAVWRSVASLPDPRPALLVRRQWLGYFERCRLTLALRLYADRHGRPAARLADLVPEFLDRVPPDPVSGREYTYQPGTTGWQLESPADLHAGPARRARTRRTL